MDLKRAKEAGMFLQVLGTRSMSSLRQIKNWAADARCRSWAATIILWQPFTKECYTCIKEIVWIQKAVCIEKIGINIEQTTVGVETEESSFPIREARGVEWGQYFHWDSESEVAPRATRFTVGQYLLGRKPPRRLQDDWNWWIFLKYLRVF